MAGICFRTRWNERRVTDDSGLQPTTLWRNLYSTYLRRKSREVNAQQVGRRNTYVGQNSVTCLMNWILALVVPGTNTVGIAAAIASPGNSILRPLTGAGTTQGSCSYDPPEVDATVGLVHIRHIKIPPAARKSIWQIPCRVYSEYSKRVPRLERLFIPQQLH